MLKRTAIVVLFFQLENLMRQIRALIWMLPNDSGFLEAKLKNHFMVTYLNLEAFAKSRPLYMTSQRDSLKEIVNRNCDTVICGIIIDFYTNA